MLLSSNFIAASRLQLARAPMKFNIKTAEKEVLD